MDTRGGFERERSKPTTLVIMGPQGMQMEVCYEPEENVLTIEATGMTLENTVEIEGQEYRVGGLQRLIGSTVVHQGKLRIVGPAAEAFWQVLSTANV